MNLNANGYFADTEFNSVSAELGTAATVSSLGTGMIAMMSRRA